MMCEDSTLQNLFEAAVMLSWLSIMIPTVASQMKMMNLFRGLTQLTSADQQKYDFCVENIYFHVEIINFTFTQPPIKKTRTIFMVSYT